MQSIAIFEPGRLAERLAPGPVIGGLLGHNNAYKHQEESMQARNKYIYDEDLWRSFWMSCFFLLVVILFFFFSSFLIFFVFPFYPQKHGNLIQIIWVTYVTWHSSHHPLVPPPLPPSSSAARRGNVRCSRMVSYLGEPDLTCRRHHE